MNITEYSLKNDKVIIVFSILIFIYGIISFINLPRAKDPTMISRNATIITYFPGASAKRVEQLVTDKLEKVAQEMVEVDHISSQSKSGVSVISVFFLDKYTDMRPIKDYLRTNINIAARSLPMGVLKPIINTENGDIYGTLISISSDGLDYNELEDIANDTKDALLRLKDVGKINILGNQEEVIYVEYDNTKLARLKISTSYLKNVLENKNIVLSGGSIKINNNRLSVEPSGNYRSIEEIKNTLIPLSSGESIYLKDIANIKHGYKTPGSFITKENSRPAIILALSIKDDGDTLRFGEEVSAKLEHIQQKLPLGVELTTIFNEPKIVERIIDDFMLNLLQAIALVIIIMIFSLGIRTGLIVATLIPMTILVSFIIMYILNIRLEQISLTALIISLGMIVDSAIVMSDSIMGLRQKGKDVFEASIISAKELKIPLLTSSLTTSAAFLPVFLAESTTGEYVGALFKVVSITLLSSWVLALTLTPVISKYFMKKEPKKNNKNNEYYNIYKKLIIFALNNKTKFIITIILLFLISIKLFDFIPKKFFSPSNEKTFTVEMDFPVGTAIETTISTVSQVEKHIQQKYMNKEDKEVLNYVSFTGESAPWFWLSYARTLLSVEHSTILVNISDFEDMSMIRKDIEEFATERFPDMKISTKVLYMGPPVDKPIAIRVSGKDVSELFKISSKIKQELSKIDGVKNIDDDWGLKNKKLVIDIDEAKALEEGINNLDIALSLQTALSGYQVTTFRKDDTLLPIILRSNKSQRDDIDRLRTISVHSQKNEKNIPLSQVATVGVVYEDSIIVRRDRLKTITVSAEVEDGYTALDIYDEVQPFMDHLSKSFELGYYYTFGGEYEASGKANKALFEHFPLAFMIILLLMVIQFNSIRKTIIILTTIPLGLIGVSIGIYITNSYYGYMTVLGIASLSGIVINNAIILLERIQLEKDENGLNHYDAIIEACLNRFRPIMLTTITTILGLFTLWWSGGVMWEPLTISIIFGLIASTILTLLFIPSLYALFYKVKQ